MGPWHTLRVIKERKGALASKAGKRVAVVERDVRANGVSVRNFGFITVTGQEGGDFWRLARRRAIVG